MPSTRPSAAPLASGNLRRSFIALLFLGTLVGALFAVLGSGSWFDIPRAVPGDTRPLPQWVTPGEVRANTRDGSLVKVRVALDAAKSWNKSAVEHRLIDITQLIALSVGVHHTDDLLGAPGLRRLAAEMLARINAYLEAEGLTRLNSVAIQDFWIARP